MDTCCGRLHFQNWPYQFLPHFTHLSHDVPLTHPHLEVGSVFLSLEPGWTFVTVSVDRMSWKHHCDFGGSVTDANEASGTLSFSLSFRRDPSLWEQPPRCAEAQATPEKPHISIQLVSRTWAPSDSQTCE